MECPYLIRLPDLEMGIPIYIIIYITGNSFKENNEEENSVQSRLPRHVAEFW